MGTSIEPPASSGTDPRSELVECTAMIFRMRTPGMYAHMAVIVLILWLGRDPAVLPSNLIMLSLLVAYVAVAIGTTVHVSSKPLDDASAKRWVLAMYAQMVALGLIYNIIFINLHRHGVPRALDYLLMVLCMFCAGGAASYQYVKGMAVTYIVSSILPLAIYYVLSGEPHGLETAVLLILFIISMSGATLKLHSDAIERLRLMRALDAAKTEAELLACTDALTGLLSRRAFFDAGQTALAAANRHNRPLTVAMLDLDHFKAINDEFGHSTGDAVLVAFADVLRREQRASDLIGRLGGEEFGLILPDTDVSTAQQVAERLRAAVERLRVEQAPKVSVSIGLAPRVSRDSTLDALIARADQAMYSAKAQGRDRVEAAD